MIFNVARNTYWITYSKQQTISRLFDILETNVTSVLLFHIQRSKCMSRKFQVHNIIYIDRKFILITNHDSKKQLGQKINISIRFFPSFFFFTYKDILKEYIYFCDHLYTFTFIMTLKFTNLRRNLAFLPDTETDFSNFLKISIGATALLLYKFD